MMKILLAILVAGSMVVGSVNPDPISMTAKPEQQYSPGKITLTIHLEPHRDNIQLCAGFRNLQGDGASMSCKLLTGQYTPITHIYIYNKLTPGEYEAFAEVYRVPQYLAGRVHVPFNVDKHP